MYEPDEQGNTLAAVAIPIGGSFGFAPLAEENVITSEDGGQRIFKLKDNYPAYRKLGLFKSDEGFEQGGEAGDKVEFFQRGYSLNGEDVLTLKVGLAQTDPIVREFIRGKTADEHGRILVGELVTAKRYLGYAETVYKPIEGQRRGLLERNNGVFFISELERDKAEKGSNRGWIATLQWEPHEWFEDHFFAEWFIYPEYVVTNPPPTISAATPGAAVAGDTVTITGTGFAAVTGVRFGTIPAANYVIDSATQIKAVVPAGTAGSAPIQVLKGSTSSATFPYTRGG
ncbi:IPT/TIG domain-containing protein [Pseudoclavibacter sp. RFBB5]|uniref:IPT/TIG domain-containing protein n=1 Tax=Pseudoclavibacter sp. RFBB5 TaxID=2080574 RepID=UPI000CE7B596|nr:IPT/TIG domain-containing protein [Pseudoclavibacter sp. RFBB5]PPG29645.1 hypothetical protein C5B97_11780 [Pseudoclavibacter sp. RFBB5]